MDFHGLPTASVGLPCKVLAKQVMAAVCCLPTAALMSMVHQNSGLLEGQTEPDIGLHIGP